MLSWKVNIAKLKPLWYFPHIQWGSQKFCRTCLWSVENTFGKKMFIDSEKFANKLSRHFSLIKGLRYIKTCWNCLYVTLSANCMEIDQANHFHDDTAWKLVLISGWSFPLQSPRGTLTLSDIFLGPYQGTALTCWDR